MWSNLVHVYPWLGKHYEQPKHLIHKTLILGESNFTKLGKFNRELVQACVKNDISTDPLEEKDTNGFCRFSTKLRRIIFGSDTAICPEDFWQDVAFYNFVQVRVGDRSRIRPTEEMWRESVPVFNEIVSRLIPRRILVLGKANWFNLLAHVEHEKIDKYKAMLTVGKHSVLAGYVNHPSSSLSYSTWQPIAKEVLFS